MTQAQLKQDTAMDRALEFKISGSYYTANKEVVDFDGVVGVIPFCDEDNGVGSMHVRGRYAKKWIKEALKKDGSKMYPDRIEKIRQVFVDDVREVKAPLSFVGKDIKELSIDEMQDLATAKDLRFVPLPDSGLSKRDMLIRTYVAYAEKVLLKVIKYQEEDFNFAKLPSIRLDGSFRTEASEKITSEEIIAEEQKSTSTDDPRTRFTMADLKKIADLKKVVYDPNVSFDDLYAKLYQKP